MNSLAVNRVAGSALVTGVLLGFVVSVFTPGAISTAVEGDFFRQQIQPWIEDDVLTHVMTMLAIVSSVLQALGFYYLLRLP